MSQDEFIRTALRVPPDLHKALHEASDNAARSFNAEIIDRLQKSFSIQEPVQLGFLAAHFEHELSKAELDKHRLRVNIIELVTMHRVLTKTILLSEDIKSDKLMAYLKEWTQRSEEIARNAEKLMVGSVEEARDAFLEANKEMHSYVESLKEAHELGIPEVGEFFPVIAEFFPEGIEAPGTQVVLSKAAEVREDKDRRLGLADAGTATPAGEGLGFKPQKKRGLADAAPASTA